MSPRLRRRARITQKEKGNVGSDGRMAGIVSPLDGGRPVGSDGRRARIFQTSSMASVSQT